jgi:hypothetical protein
MCGSNDINAQPSIDISTHLLLGSKFYIEPSFHKSSCFRTKSKLLVEQRKGVKQYCCSRQASRYLHFLSHFLMGPYVSMTWHLCQSLCHLWCSQCLWPRIHILGECCHHNLLRYHGHGILHSVTKANQGFIVLDCGGGCEGFPSQV